MTNRMRLLRAANDLGKIMEGLSPTPYANLQAARREIMAASQFPLDLEERNDMTKIDGFSTGLSAVREP